MADSVLGFLQDAREMALNDPAKSRELSLVITKIDEAILWRSEDLRLKSPSQGQGSRSLASGR